MVKEPIRLRGHHLFCMNVIDLTGDPIYNPRFCENARTYQEELKTNKNCQVEIVAHCGGTCRYCPSWNQTDDKCVLYDYEPGANLIDLRVLRALGLGVGDQTTAGELRRRIKDAYGNDLPDMCFTECGLMSLLCCQEGLDKLHTDI